MCFDNKNRSEVPLIWSLRWTEWDWKNQKQLTAAGYQDKMWETRNKKVPKMTKARLLFPIVSCLGGVLAVYWLGIGYVLVVLSYWCGRWWCRLRRCCLSYLLDWLGSLKVCPFIELSVLSIGWWWWSFVKPCEVLFWKVWICTCWVVVKKNAKLYMLSWTKLRRWYESIAQKQSRTRNEGGGMTP